MFYSRATLPRLLPLAGFGAVGFGTEAATDRWATGRLRDVHALSPPVPA